jgi:hypothetical protein
MYGFPDLGALLFVGAHKVNFADFMTQIGAEYRPDCTALTVFLGIL